MPVTVAIFVNPGHSGEPFPANRWSASNRSFEYDTLSDQYARFLQLELIPHVQQELQLKLSTDPEDRALCGISSGGICAFTAAWEHPEWFRKVLSHVGSFTNLRGGHNYEALLGPTEQRPLRGLRLGGEVGRDRA
ncbi:MAG: alpha/beta hydrolase, partial [Planctomycetaceae bacterium]